MIRFALIMSEKILLEEIADPRMKQADVILTYALALQSGEAINWENVNRAIIERWSPSGLRCIKYAAWKTVAPR